MPTFLAPASIGPVAASVGGLRLQNNSGISWRNSANTGDWGQVVFNAASRLQYEGNQGHQWYNSGVQVMAHTAGGLDVTGFVAPTTYVAIGTNPANAGALRLPNNAYCYWKNAANTANVAVLVMGADDNTYLAASAGHSVNLGLEGTANWLTATATGTSVVGSFSVGGLTGATAASRLVGATATGAPGTGTFAKGDVVIDQTGRIWINTTAGSPGTWTNAGDSGGFWSDTKWAVD